jgi:toxin CcdB
MAQFDIYENSNPRSKSAYPFFIDIQSELLNDLNSRVVIPLSPLEMVSQPAQRLCPVIELNQVSYVLMTHQITSVPISSLKNSVISAIPHRDEILAAIDMVISGF